MVKVNTFLSSGDVVTNKLESYFEKEKQKLLSDFSIPNFSQRKIIQKLTKTKNLLRKLLKSKDEEEVVEKDDMPIFNISDVFTVL